jgi:hypothetical protein
MYYGNSNLKFITFQGICGIFRGNAMFTIQILKIEWLRVIGFIALKNNELRFCKGWFVSKIWVEMAVIKLVTYSLIQIQ